ncbi:DUF1833 domain-containing protein [Alcaligenes aquatilis]|uniref:DUF1833 family protein n=1 Tax=Alcaligenes aquatilis TaxID=323284 RepID=UPI000E9E7EAA|nr:MULTISPECIES: DUF1833 family protein [Alcaligenes]QXR37324.1 DUF1833 domain-containing protein [Alcaligenes aquatilis]HBQ88661.1 hypothetical protein [Alcaligenes faecalis]
MTITKEFRRNRQKVTDPDGVVALLEITHSSFSAPFRLANDTKAWISRGVTYVGYPFRFTLPDSSEGESPKMVLEMDNTGGDILRELESIREPGEEVWCSIIMIDRSMPDVHAMKLSLPISVVAVDSSSLSAKPSMDSILNRSAVTLRYDKRTAPGIFQ